MSIPSTAGRPARRSYAARRNGRSTPLRRAIGSCRPLAGNGRVWQCVRRCRPAAGTTVMPGAALPASGRHYRMPGTALPASGRHYNARRCFTSAATRAVSRSGSMRSYCQSSQCGCNRPRARNCCWKRARRPCAVLASATITGMRVAHASEQVHRIGRDHHAVGPAEQATIGIGAVAAIAPDHVRQVGEFRAQDLGQGRRRTTRGRCQQAAAFAADLLGQRLEHADHRGLVPRCQRRRPTDQQCGARAGQGTEAGERGAAPGQPVIVHRVEAAEQGQHVAAAQGIVFGHHHHVPMAGADARVEDLHHLAAACSTQHARLRPGARSRWPAPAPRWLVTQRPRRSR